jgi:hypothetical protein
VGAAVLVHAVLVSTFPDAAAPADAALRVTALSVRSPPTGCLFGGLPPDVVVPVDVARDVVAAIGVAFGPASSVGSAAGGAPVRISYGCSLGEHALVGVTAAGSVRRSVRGGWDRSTSRRVRPVASTEADTTALAFTASPSHTDPALCPSCRAPYVVPLVPWLSCCGSRAEVLMRGPVRRGR